MRTAATMSMSQTYPHAIGASEERSQIRRARSLDRIQTRENLTQSRARFGERAPGSTKLVNQGSSLETFISDPSRTRPDGHQPTSCQFTDDSSHSIFFGETTHEFRETSHDFPLKSKKVQNNCCQKTEDRSFEQEENSLAVSELARNIAEQMANIGIDIDFNLEVYVRKMMDLGEKLTEEALQDIFGVNDCNCSISKYTCYRVVLAVCTAE